MKTIAIFCAGQSGDCLEISGVLKYRDELWGEHKLVWYIDDANRDLLSHQDIELRTFPRGFGYPEMVVEENNKLIAEGKEPIWEDWQPLVDENNHLNLELKHNYPSLSDIDYGYFPAPHQIPATKRHNVEYSNCSKMVFGVPDNYEWHPCIDFDENDYTLVEKFTSKLPKCNNILIETFAGSGQSLLDEEMIIEAMMLCSVNVGRCNFIFASHKFLRSNETFPAYLFDRPGIYSCKDVSVRQCALIAGGCDLILSVSSGITVAASCWYNKKVPILQFCGSEVCSTKAIALGRFELVTADERSLQSAKNEYYSKLTQLLIELK
jgi:hypothetical protein